MEEKKTSLIVRAAFFAVGMGILLFSIFTVALSAAYEIAYAPVYFDTTMYNMAGAIGGAMGSGFGSLLIFIGWHSK